jgi:hypothetical protein
MAFNDKAGATFPAAHLKVSSAEVFARFACYRGVDSYFLYRGSCRFRSPKVCSTLKAHSCEREYLLVLVYVRDRLRDHGAARPSIRNAMAAHLSRTSSIPHLQQRWTTC